MVKIPFNSKRNFPEVPKQFEEEFSNRVRSRNLARIRVMAWVLLLALPIYSFTDYLHFTNLNTPEGWETFSGLAVMRGCMIAFALTILYLIGPPRPREEPTQHHRHLDIVFAYGCLIYVPIIVAYMYSFRPDVSVFLFFVFVSSGFLFFPPRQNFSLLSVSYLTFAIALPLMGNSWVSYKYSLITAGLMVILCYWLSRFIFGTMIREFVNQRLIEKQTKDLEQAKDAADEANQAKSDFLASMSHEIRTPMHAIVGMTEVSLEKKLDDDINENLSTVLDAAHHLLAIIDDILDFSKIEAGKMTIEEVDFDLGETLRSVAQIQRLAAEEKGLILLLEIDPDLPLILKGDPVRIRQILQNLTFNAIKFTETGSVRIKAYSAGPAAAPSQITLRLVVTDTGIGVPPQQQQLIFEGFKQADSSTTRKHGGTGLGLTICRRLARLMGGTLSLTSTVNQGSSFTLSLPLPLGAPDRIKSQASPVPMNTQQFKILVVDDNSMNRKVATAQLQQLGHLPITVGSGPEALTILPQGDFDMVLIDVEMPGMDGIETTTIIRQGGPTYDWPDELRTLPVVAMTAHALAEVRTRALAAGMDDFITKPVNFKRLQTVISAIRPNGDGKEDVPSDTNQPDTVARLDANAARAYLGVDEATFSIIVQTGLKELAANSEMAGEALAGSDMVQAAALAHDLKSMAQTLGAMALHLFAKELELAAKTGDVDMAVQCHNALLAELTHVQKAMTPK